VAHAYILNFQIVKVLVSSDSSHKQNS